jgi:hypothetical protein
MPAGMDHEPVFRREGESFLPTSSATGPWGQDRLHGGPVLGLFARAFEAAAGDPELVIARLTCDLFRPVPVAPLTLRVEPLRRGSRLSLLQAELLVGNEPFARASALLLRAGDADGATSTPAPQRPQGPSGLADESLMRGFRRDEGFPPGFHVRVLTRWPQRASGDPLAIWFRMPIALVQGEQPSPLQAAAALADFANAVANIAAQAHGTPPTPYINTDATLYLTRRPEGEWFCLQEQASEADRGVSVGEVLLWDETGLFGRALQARLANRYQR